MDIENIDEAEQLIEKLRTVQAAKESINAATGEDGGSYETFALVEKDTHIEIELPGLKAEVMEAIGSVLNEQYDKITARLREI
ncbi:hypothetical protein Tgr7_0402 [Thioalkalivibrio sulfidiphilus HL-EbGr7]|uniref:Uncharacterized protein n=1 Tax=Thioalkalivibrio sulfidiphilus (strain HL-EbGR7) TaxID=396588 RepID=B8GUY9_THISH|nr:hypothetical protein [Thioalkalivibrio sulfidiphilus]ACL71500.1 hypothetical protein Tgr7_0402 [Thioalkalivibrio sulfidiphilus HL-EbGr7]